MKHYKAILFDLDGTLVDHDSAAHQAAHDWAVELGMEPDVQRWIDIETKWFKRFEEGKCTHTGQRVERVREYLNEPELSEQRCHELFTIFIKHYEANWRPFPDAEQALKNAANTGALVGILTNGAEELQMSKMTKTNLWQKDMIMLAAKELGAAKPQAECYQRCEERIAEHLGHEIAPGDVLLIGDHNINDVKGAIAVGWDAILLDRDSAAEKTDAYPVISSLDQLN